MQAPKHKGAIVLGDSSTIVTETDSSYLRDLVTDIEPVVVPEPVPSAPKPQDQAGIPKTETAPAIATDHSNTQGFTIDFGNAKAVITGITTRTFRKQNPEKDAGVSYARSSGDLSKSDLLIYGLKKTKVRMRSQTRLYLKSSAGTLELAGLGSHISDWAEISGREASGYIRYDLNDLRNLKFKSFSRSSLKNAVIRAARKQNLKQTAVNKWLAKISRTRDATDSPCQIRLMNLQLQISGTDARGRRFFKTVRIDN